MFKKTVLALVLAGAATFALQGSASAGYNNYDYGNSYHNNYDDNYYNYDDSYGDKARVLQLRRLLGEVRLLEGPVRLLPHPQGREVDEPLVQQVVLLLALS